MEKKTENNNLSIYENDGHIDNPYLIRLVVKKIDFKKYLKKILNFPLKTKQEHLTIFLNIIIKKLDENKINYVIFFGNLIGILRHDNLFIPWDDDIDILVDKTSINKIVEIFEDYSMSYYDSYLLKISKYNLSIDIFYNHSINELVSIKKFKYYNDYKIPIDYLDAFKSFYGDMNVNFISECVIYNHNINDRWNCENFIKIIKDINYVNKIIKEINCDNQKDIEKLINEINIPYKKIHNNIAIYIIIASYNLNCPYKLIEFIKNKSQYVFFDVHIYLSEYLYNYLNIYDEKINAYNIYLHKNENIFNSIYDKNICKEYLNLDKKINENKYSKIIFYHVSINFPIFINEYNKNKVYTNSIEEINLAKKGKIKLQSAKDFLNEL
jgi:hypothetical protein